jgi:tetraacyldisaccharide 4'-kinase
MGFVSPQLVEKIWYGDHPFGIALAPLGWLYATGMRLRRLAYRAGLLPVRGVDVPVIVVGSLNVGGTGKTPLVIWIAEHLKALGFRPGIVSRGYGGIGRKFPQQVRPDSNPELVGDEPVLIASRTGCPVAVSPKRYQAARDLVSHTDCNIIICDDGLQHLALDRDIEIATIDGVRRFGNGRCLPAGPLRESPGRLAGVDMVVSVARAGKSEYLMVYVPRALQSLGVPARCMELEALRGRDVHAVAGIANPRRFFAMLNEAGLRIVRHEFPDHHRFTEGDVRFDDGLPVVMTEKDAVKCRGLGTRDAWCLPIDAHMTDAFRHRLTTLIRETQVGSKAA